MCEGLKDLSSFVVSCKTLFQKQKKKEKLRPGLRKEPWVTVGTGSLYWVYSRTSLVTPRNLTCPKRLGPTD